VTDSYKLFAGPSHRAAGQEGDCLVGTFSSVNECRGRWEQIKSLPVPPTVQDGYSTGVFAWALVAGADGTAEVIL
jgi:hypothetical protein